MFSTVFSLVSPYILNPYFWIGYVFAVLFPIPFINSTIISIWSVYGSKIKGLFTVSTAETIVSEAITSIETIGTAKPAAASTVQTTTTA